MKIPKYYAYKGDQCVRLKMNHHPNVIALTIQHQLSMLGIYRERFKDKKIVHRSELPSITLESHLWERLVKELGVNNKTKKVYISIKHAGYKIFSFNKPVTKKELVL
jgi:hypothetical protein